MNQLQEVDYKALRLLMQRAAGSNHAKQRTLRKFDLAWKHGNLVYPANETDEQRWWRCEARFCLGDYTDWTGWQYRDKFAQRNWLTNPYSVPVWNCKPVGRLYITGEQGLGDEVLLSQCLHNVAPFADEIVYETFDRLMPIMERNFPVKCVPSLITGERRKAQKFEADAWVGIGELPRAFRRARTDFPRQPYITALPDARVEKYRGKVGLMWRGAQGTCDWKKLKALYPDAISLQYDHYDEDIERTDIDIKNDLEGLLSLLSVLERVVGVSNTTAHFAAASGVETDLILADPNTGIRSYLMPWRWLDMSCKKTPKQALWYGDNVKVWTSLNEYMAYH